MKEYINKSNRKIIKYSWLAFASYMIMMYKLFDINSFSNIFLTLIVILVVSLIIISNSQEKNFVDDEKLVVKRIRAKEFYWDDIAEVLIGEWFIQIISREYNRAKILKKVSEEDVFESLKEEIISHSQPGLIKYDEPEKAEDGKKEGGLTVVYVHIVIAAIRGAIDIITIIVTLILNFKFDLSFVLSVFIIILAIVLVILSLKILVRFKKREVKLIGMIKNSVICSTALSIIANVNNFVISFNSADFSLLKQSVSILGSFLYIILIALIFFEYLNSSERVKHYFIK